MPNKPAAPVDDVKSYVIDRINAGHGQNLAQQIQVEFDVSRPTAHAYLNKLIDEELISRAALGRYQLVEDEYDFHLEVEGLEEHLVWRDLVSPVLSPLPDNVLRICEYGCNEIVNNVIDHSESKTAQVIVRVSRHQTTIRIMDNGVGIFRKIASEFELEDDRHAVLELSKGKVTTDPINHTGEGIFFSSRAFEAFDIFSGGVFFSHDRDREEDWILGGEQPTREVHGTVVTMQIKNDSDRNLHEVFDQYTTEPETYGFDKTVVPVKMMRYGDDQLVSRSQAKRLMRQLDRFRTVVLNFEDVPSVGPAFADEIFRVFQSIHPEVDILAVNANEQITRMIRRATKEESA